MTTAEKRIRFKKVPSPSYSHQSVKATYAVLINGKIEGHVDKYVERVMTNPGSRGGQGQRHRTDTYWGWRRPGKPDGDSTGYDRRSDAVTWLLRSIEKDDE